MNQKKILLLVVAALVILLATTYPLYNRLSKDNQTNQLVTIPQQEKPAATTPPTTQPANPTETTPIQPTQPPAIEPEETTAPSHPPAAQPTEPPIPLEHDFTVVDGNGNSVKLSDYVGKPIVLNFWASWCGPCKSEMPEFQQVYEEIGEQVQFLMVNATAGGDTVENAKSFIQASGYTFPVLFDTKADAMYTFGVDAFPTTFFLDKTGEVTAYVVGAISKTTLLQGIDMITKQ